MQVMATAATACNFCGRWLAQNEIHYTAAAAIACAECNAKADAVMLNARASESEARTGLNSVVFSVLTLLAGVISIVLNPWFLTTLFSVACAVYLLAASNQPQLRSYRPVMLACGIVSLVLNAGVVYLTYAVITAAHRM